ncbi:hypothetical protein K456DRAFT_416053 [Colletotrichum gloeosporioides 23]|nr:hypothetical protein K456DRAFT_416053 [Colletotrichum gloeosporioides 23]
MPGQNDGDNGRLDHDPFQDVLPLYEQFRVEKGSPRVSRNMRCPVMFFRSGEYGGRVVSCHGAGYNSFRTLNEHIKRQHHPDLADPEAKTARPAPLLPRENYQAWYRWKSKIFRPGIPMNDDDKRDKWWVTVQKLGLAKRPKSPPTSLHLASPVDEILFVYEFLVVYEFLDRHRRPANNMPSMEEQYEKGFKDGFEEACYYNGKEENVLPVRPDCGCGEIGSGEPHKDDGLPHPVGQPHASSQCPEDNMSL